MTDGLLSIKDRRKADPNAPGKESSSQQAKAKQTSFNSYRYASPSLFNTSNVIFRNFLRKIKEKLV
jgi:hypothetical protein